MSERTVPSPYDRAAGEASHETFGASGRGSVLHRLPIALTFLRGALGAAVLTLAFLRPAPAAFAACLVAALLSDYFDGVLARRLGIATPSLRRLDSAIDSVFYLCALVAAWRLHAALLRPYLTPLAALLAVEALRYAFDFRKFGKEASYHMWSSKLWGLALFAAFFVVLVRGEAGWPVATAIYLGIAADLEGLAISAVLPRWQSDVPTLMHAIRRSGSGA
jgi:CDP-diacylglycerol--glycerol-3-phosphate 3-phosphatidyltransferase